MKKPFCGGIFLSFLLLTTLAMAEPITYNISWVASGTYATTFQDAAFKMSLAGDTLNVINNSGLITNEGMTGNLIGPYGTKTTYTDQILGNNPFPVPIPTFAWGYDSANFKTIMECDAVASGLGTYNLKSAIGPTSLIGASFASENNLSNYVFTNAKDFTFEAVTASSAVPLPSTVFLLGSGLLGLAGWRRLRKT